MPTPILPQRPLRATRLGEKAAFTRTLTEADAALFLSLIHI